MEPPSLEEIREAFPQFEILELIGSGGMGAVFKVRQPKLDRLVALKVLPKSLAGDERFTERFTREARALAKLNHPNIVAVHDFGESEIGGFHFLLMEFVDGANLREAMRAGRFTPQQAFEVVPEICAALQYAHDEGVLHRDIKPENLLLDTKGRVKIVDFGIAKLVGAEVEAPLTGSYAPGTPQYMAPEQIEHPADVDHRADIYSLGVVFYEMLTGELPIGRFAAPSEKAQVGGQVDDIVFRTLEKEPARRQQSAAEVKTQVEGIDESQPPPLSERTKPNGGHFRHHAGGHSAHSRRAGRALLLLTASVVVLALVWGTSIGIAYKARSSELDAKMAAQVEEAKVHEEAAALFARAEYGRENGFPQEVIDGLEEEGQKVSTRLEQTRREKRRADSGMNGIVALLMLLSILAGVLIAAAAVFATVRGWQDLRDLRRTAAAGERGTISAMIAALLMPVLVVGALIFVVLVLPASGQWAGPALSLAVIAIAAASVWMIMRTWRWLNTPLTEQERRVWRESQQGDSTGAQQPRRRRWWIVIIIAVLLVPVLLIGSCSIWLMASRDTAKEAEMRARDLARQTMGQRAAVAEAEAVGDDLSKVERQVVGSWAFDQGLDVGKSQFHADRTWEMDTADGRLTIEGRWRVAGNVLLQTVIRSSESEQVGRIIEAEILTLIDDKKLVLRDKEGGDELTLRPIFAMSDIERSLLGGWKLEGFSHGSVVAEVVFSRLHFWSDRTWALDGTVMDQPPSQWKVVDRTLILAAANEKKNDVVRCDIVRNTDHMLTLRRLDTGKTMNYLRSSPAPPLSVESESKSESDAEVAEEPPQ
jgi:tRNA A-37 threonylcarbamoyl transferase component Bud32